MAAGRPVLLLIDGLFARWFKPARQEFYSPGDSMAWRMSVRRLQPNRRNAAGWEKTGGSICFIILTGRSLPGNCYCWLKKCGGRMAEKLLIVEDGSCFAGDARLQLVRQG